MSKRGYAVRPVFHPCSNAMSYRLSEGAELVQLGRRELHLQTKAREGAVHSSNGAHHTTFIKVHPHLCEAVTLLQLARSCNWQGISIVPFVSPLSVNCTTVSYLPGGTFHLGWHSTVRTLLRSGAHFVLFPTSLESPSILADNSWCFPGRFHSGTQESPKVGQSRQGRRAQEIHVKTALSKVCQTLTVVSELPMTVCDTSINQSETSLDPKSCTCSLSTPKRFRLYRTREALQRSEGLARL